MAICTVSGKLVDASSTAISGATVTFNIQQPILSADPVEGSTTTATDGTWSLDLQQGLSGVFTIPISPSPATKKIYYRFNVNIPNTSTATFSSILVDN